MRYYRQTLQGSFSAVSKPNFASKHSLESSCRDLHNALLCTVFQSQNFSQKLSTFFRDWINEFPIFSFFSSNFAFFCEFFMNFFPDFAPNSRKEWRLSLFNQICENFGKFNNKFAKFWQKIVLRTVQKSALCRSRRALSNWYFLAKFQFWYRYSWKRALIPHPKLDR